MSEYKDLKTSTIKGSLWATVERFSLQIIQFVVSIILARLLLPEDFGLVALTTIFITISFAITDGGFEKALIQRKELTALQINTAFYINLALGFIMMAVIMLTSPFIASFFNEPELNLILRILSLVLPLEALGQIQRTLLMKELQFKKISIAQIASTFAGGIFGVCLAYSGFGVWSLVYSSLLGAFIKLFIFWYRSDWYPKLEFSYHSISSIVPFGLNVLSSSVLFFVLQQFSNFIIGKFYSKAELGLFNRGSKLPEIITGTLQSIVLKISLPIFSKIQEDTEQVKFLLNKTSGLIALISFPLLGFLFFYAEEIVLVLLTEKWLGCVFYLKIFCIIRFLEPFITVQRELLLSKGKSKLLLHLFIITSLIEIVPMVLLISKGIIYIVWLSLAAKVIQFIVYLMVASKDINNIVIDTGKQLLTYLVIYLLAISPTLFLSNYLNINILLKLSLSAIISFILYFLICLFFDLQEVKSLKSAILPMLKRKK